MSADYVILGAGISGLYLGVELLKKAKKVLLIEKLDRIGGRIYSKKYKETTYESGAGRFSDTHFRLLDLIERYGLMDRMIPLEETKTKIFDNKEKYSNDIRALMERLFEKQKDFSREQLIQWTTFEFLNEVLGKEQTKHFIYLYGYRGEILYGNALCGLQMFQLDYETNSFYSLAGGLQQIIDNLKKEFLQKGGILLMQKKVTNIFHDQLRDRILLDVNNNIVECKKLILAIPPHEIINLKPKNEHILEATSGLVPVKLLRIYYFYDEPNETIRDLKKIITDLDINFIIPISDKAIMISYSDTGIAQDWYTLYYSNRELFKQKMMDEFYHCTSIALKNPDKITLEYWEKGVHVWAPGVDFEENYKSRINPIKNIYLANEAFSKHQGWMESSLEVADDILEML